MSCPRRYFTSGEAYYVSRPDGYVLTVGWDEAAGIWEEVVRQRTELVVPVQDVAAEHRLTRVHSPARCVGRGCSIHHPSAHHMRDWPRYWRSWHGYFERLCPHGVGHPDPDDMAYFMSTAEPEMYYAGIHGCCPEGCCFS